MPDLTLYRDDVDELINALRGEHHLNYSNGRLIDLLLDRLNQNLHAARDGREPRPEHQMFGRDPVFKHHNCWKCDDGLKPCVSAPGACDYLRARND